MALWHQTGSASWRTSLLWLGLGCLALAPSTAAGQAVLFQDDFQSGDLSAWSFGAPSCNSFAVTWGATDGRLCGTIVGCNQCSVAVVGNPAWSNYAVSADITLTAGVNRTLILYWQDIFVKAHINLRASTLGDQGQLFLLAGYDTVIQAAAFTTVDGQTYRVRAGIFDTTFGVEVNGQLVASVDILPYILAGLIPTHGRPGVDVWSGGQCPGNSACFDNYLVEALAAVPTEPSSWGAVKSLYR